jgi:hypothetical protein
MNKLAILFGTTTVAFAGLTLYYASELRKENDFFDAQSTLARAAPTTSPTPAPSDSSPIHSTQSPTPEAMSPGTQVPVSTASAPKSGTAANNPTANAAGKPAQKMSAADLDFVAMYASPQGRRTLIDEALMDQRNGRRDMAERLGLTEEHWQRVLEVFAEQQVEARAALLRCRADPACKSPFTPEQIADRKQAVRDAIGEDKYDDYERYANTMNERRTVAELQKQLTGSLSLPADRAEALIAALVAEREAALRELTDSGGQIAGIGVPYGFAYYNAIAPTLEARMESALQYSSRIRERAATVLNANQIVAFNQMQDQVMATLRNYLARQAPPPPPKQQKDENKAAQKAEQKVART